MQCMSCQVGQRGPVESRCRREIRAISLHAGQVYIHLRPPGIGWRCRCRRYRVGRQLEGGRLGFSGDSGSADRLQVRSWDVSLSIRSDHCTDVNAATIKKAKRGMICASLANIAEIHKPRDLVAFLPVSGAIALAILQVNGLRAVPSITALDQGKPGGRQEARCRESRKCVHESLFAQQSQEPINSLKAWHLV